MSSVHKGLSKEQLAKDQESDENIAKMLTQLDLLTKHIIGGKPEECYDVAAAGDVVYDKVLYERGYSEEIHYMGNQVMGSQPAFPSPPENQG